jgi:hypothetical protein
MPTASARCRSSLAMGSALVATRSARRISILGSSPLSPMTEGMSSESRDRAWSELQSLTIRARKASAGCVQAGWSLHRSPAR